jgi:thioredoxin reductase (NADPH)
MHDLIIIGAGPSGLTAALYAGRYMLDTLLLEKVGAGGQILMTPSIENFPGFPGGVVTADLVAAMKKQVDDVGVKMVDGEAARIEVERGQHHHSYTVFTHDGCFKSKCLIIAAGAGWKKLGVPGEDTLTGKGVAYCATCDGPLFRNKEVVVVGGGDKAMEEAIFLSSYASKVTVVHRRQQFRATEVLVEKAKANPKIQFVLDSTVEQVNGQVRVESVVIKDLKANSTRDFPCQGIFVCIGISPNTGFIKDVLETDEYGFIVTDDSMKTSLHGVFACGDCRKKTLYQVVTGCGEGAVACNSVHTYLLNR